MVPQADQNAWTLIGFGLDLSETLRFDGRCGQNQAERFRCPVEAVPVPTAKD